MKDPHHTHNQLNTIMEISWQLGVVKDATGSASIKYDTSFCVCSIHGPKSLQKGNTISSVAELIDDSGVSDIGTVTCTVKFASHLTHTNFYDNDSNSDVSIQLSETAYSMFVKDALKSTIRLDQYPKSVISIYLVLLESSSYDIPALVNCASLAILDSGIEMFDFVTCSSICVPYQLIAPENDNYDDKDLQYVQVTVALSSESGELTQLRVKGTLSDSTPLTSLVRKTTQQCVQLKEMIESYLTGTSSVSIGILTNPPI